MHHRERSPRLRNARISIASQLLVRRLLPSPIIVEFDTLHSNFVYLSAARSLS